MDKLIYRPIELKSQKYKSQYVVIGSGAGGSVAAMELAESGKDVIILEEGFEYKTTDFNDNISEMTQATWRNGGVTPFWGKPPIGFAEGKCVGGGTVINGGLLWRTPDRMLKVWNEQYGITGFSKDDLKPHFEKIENILKVGYHKIDDENKDSDILINGCDKLGWNYVPVPRSGGENCINLNLCPTGCPSGAKQSTALTYIPRALKTGARMFTGCKVLKINKNRNDLNEVIVELADSQSKREIYIECEFLFIAAGAIQTPFLLKNSNLAQNAGNKLEFHFNLKFVAEFEKKINAQDATIFTMQVQEFMDEGLLIMPSNYRQNYLAMTMSHFNNNEINNVMEKYDYCGLFVAQIQANSKAKIVSSFRKEPFVHYSFDDNDMPLVIDAIKKTVKLLFYSGATKVYLPIIGSSPIKNYISDLENQLHNIKAKNLEIVSVHAMSSCPMGIDDNSVTDLSGKLYGSNNIYITDASILPSNIGESPQGTIMALAHKILDEHISNY